jgi:hypothetical protein
LGLSACSTSGIDIGAQLEAVSAEAEAELADAKGLAETASDGEEAQLPEELAVIPAERSQERVTVDTTTPPVMAAAYAGPTPSGVQAIAAATSAAASTGPACGPSTPSRTSRRARSRPAAPNSMR